MADKPSRPPKSTYGTGSSAPAEQERPALLPTLGTIGNLRDALLVGAGTVYILGYLTWSISAYAHGLGLLPALEAQYFMAGVVPAIILGVVLLLLYKLATVNDFFRRLFGPDKVILKGAFRYVAYGCLAIAILAFTLEVSWREGWLETRILGPSGVILYNAVLPVSMMSAPYLLRYKGLKAQVSAPKFQLVYAAALMAGLGLWGYGAYFENLPQEFGGIGSRCAYLDVRSDQVSPDTLADLTEPSERRSAIPQAHAASAGDGAPRENRSGAAQEGQAAEVVRSRSVDVRAPLKILLFRALSI